jgi:DNA-binding GntR family transcriptional regulator
MGFHLAAGKAVKLMAPTARRMEQQLRLYIASTNMLKPDDWSGVVEQHQLFASALIGKNPERVAREAWLHNETFGRELMSLMRDENNA